MEQTVLTIIVLRSAASFLFICAGIAALIIGGRLYLKGLGVAPDGATVDTKNGPINIRASLKTVGSVVMATSIAWGILAYLSLPHLDSQNKDERNSVNALGH